jgi:hypothetical protein
MLRHTRVPTRVPNFVETLDHPMAVALQGALQGRAHTEESLSSAVETFQRQLEQSAALALQGAVRCLVARREAHAVRTLRACVRVQAYIRMWRARAHYQDERESIVKLQSLSRSRVARGRYLSIQHVTRVLQSLVRSRRLKLKYRAVKEGALLAQAYVRGQLERAMFQSDVARPVVRARLASLLPYWRALGVSVYYTSTTANACLVAPGMAGLRRVNYELARMQALNLTVDVGPPASRRSEPASRGRGVFSCACGQPNQEQERARRRRPGLDRDTVEGNMDDDLRRARAQNDQVHRTIYELLSSMNHQVIQDWYTALRVPLEGKRRKAQLLAAMEVEACNDDFGMATRVHALVITSVHS